MLTLSRRWVDDLMHQPETGMDYQIATVVLKDGRRFPRTMIQGSYYVTSVGDDTEIPFAESDIGSIIVDHGKKQSTFFYLKRFSRRTMARIKEAIRGRR